MPNISRQTNLRQYVKHVESYKRLSLEEEQHLSTEYQEGNVEAFKKLVMHNLYNVVWNAYSFKNYGLPIDDLIQEGNIGLLEAVKKYDISRNFKVSSFAKMRIRSKMIDYIIGNWSLTKAITSKAHRKMFFNLRKEKRNLDVLSEENITQIADKYNVEEKDVIHMDSVLYSTYSNIDEEVISETLPDTNAQTPEEILLDSDEVDYKKRLLLESLEILKPVERDVICSRYLTDKPVNMKVLAERHGVTHQRISQMIKSSIVKIEKHIKENI